MIETALLIGFQILLTSIFRAVFPFNHRLSYGKEALNNFDPSIPRIAYGAPVDITEYPYFVDLEYCGGAILSEEWVVTAGHCVYPWQIAERYVLVGGKNNENSKYVVIEDIILHPYYVDLGSMVLNDIALIKLAEPLEFGENIQPLALPSEDEGLEVGSKHVFIGKGVDETNNPTKDLMKMEVNIYPAERCYPEIFTTVNWYMNLFKHWLNDTTICSKRVENLPGAGPGDSGSPMVKDDVLIGIASYGTSPRNSRVMFLTNVAYYVPWINSVIGEFDSTEQKKYLFWSEEDLNSINPLLEGFDYK